MTTPLQRLLNLAFVVFAPLPVLGVLIFVLNDFAGDDRAAAVLMGIFTFAPMMLLGAINFVLYKKWTLWHASIGSNCKKQVLTALIPTFITFIYVVAVSIFFWVDTKHLYLECTILKSKDKPHVDSIMRFQIKPICAHRYCSSSPMQYLSFVGSGWIGGPYLGIRAWDFRSESWVDPLPTTHYGDYGSEIFNPDGGLLVRDKEFVIRGFPVDEEKLARLKSLYGEEVDQYQARRYFDHLTISRITGKFTTHDGDEGVCKESSSPMANKTSSVSTKF